MPLTPTVVELRLVAQQAAASLAALGPAPTASDLEDHRTAVMGELLDALDRVDCGLGTRLMLVLYPNTNGLMS